MRNSYLGRVFLLFPLLVMLVLSSPIVAFAQDVEGSRDHPVIKRYPGSIISKYSQQEFGEYQLILGPYTDSGKFKKTKPLEGKITLIEYKNPQGRSALEIFRNYEMALKQAGFEVLFTCNNKQGECGSNWITHEPLGYLGGGYDGRYLAAKLRRQQGDVYVALHAEDYYRNTYLNIIETRQMETGLVTVDATAMAGDISRTGHVAIYGIYFDFNKAEVKPESEPALKEIAKLLKQDPKLKLHVVGHTDSVGELKFNMDLSKRRADSVIKELTIKHGIAAARLRADGVGPLSPVASNKTDEGRAKNRRVELVEQ
ncbi:MAG: DUF4892 domain-containing protein [Nitrospirae bacterium]|nr:DUF4892 domain-containing protein [Nitrospirota bacterium]